jgi:hypothetical protein
MDASDPPRLIEGAGRSATLLRAYARGTRVSVTAPRARRSSATTWASALAFGAAMACLITGRLAASAHAGAHPSFARGTGGAEGSSGGRRAAAGAGAID